METISLIDRNAAAVKSPLKKVNVTLFVLISSAVAIVLAVYVPGIITGLLACCLAGMTLGFLLVEFFLEMLAVLPLRKGAEKKTSYKKMGDAMSTAKSNFPSASGKPTPNPSIAGHLANTLRAGFRGVFFSDKLNRDEEINFDAIDDAILRFEEEVSNQSLEVDLIYTAINVFNQECHDLSQNFSSKGAVRLRTSDDNLERFFSFRCEQSIAQTAELHEFLGNYPKFQSTGNFSLETIEDHIEARRDHHVQSGLMAEVILPNLNSLLNEARLLRDTRAAPGCR